MEEQIQPEQESNEEEFGFELPEWNLPELDFGFTEVLYN